jgi:hypothetical protein
MCKLQQSSSAGSSPLQTQPQAGPSITIEIQTLPGPAFQENTDAITKAANLPPASEASTGIVFASGGPRSAFSFPANPALAVGVNPTTGLPQARPASGRPDVIDFLLRIDF